MRLALFDKAAHSTQSHAMSITKFYAVFFTKLRVKSLALSRATLLFVLWRGYKLFVSPIFGNSCRFYPTCSHYAYMLLTQETLLRASLKILYRLLRCQPFSQGGIEYPIITRTLRVNPFMESPKLRCVCQHCGRQHFQLERIVYWLVPLDFYKTESTLVSVLESHTTSLDAKQPYKLDRQFSKRSRYILIPHFRSINEKR